MLIPLIGLICIRVVIGSKRSEHQRVPFSTMKGFPKRSPQASFELGAVRIHDVAHANLLSIELMRLSKEAALLNALLRNLTPSSDVG